MEAWAAQVEQVLRRAHALFGEPADSGGSAAVAAGSRLASAGQQVHGGAQRVSGLSGQLSTRYGVFAADAGAALDGQAGADTGLGSALDAAVLGDRSGRTDSGTVLSAASADRSGLAPVSGTPAGQRALIVALRARVAQQQQVVAAYRARDAQLAAVLRSMTYGRPTGLGSGAGGAEMPGGGPGLGSALSSGSGLLSRLPGLAGRGHPPRHPQATLVSHLDADAERVPGGPGEVAVAAALSKRGRPYVWGAKGPGSFDCSGLTGWAWRQAGVQLGADTYHQIEDGVPVPPGQVRAGDLIFPKDSFDGRGPGHVQLAISPTQVVHAPQPGDVVRVTAMPSSFVARRPVSLAGPPK